MNIIVKDFFNIRSAFLILLSKKKSIPDITFLFFIYRYINVKFSLRTKLITSHTTIILKIRTQTDYIILKICVLYL